MLLVAWNPFYFHLLNWLVIRPVWQQKASARPPSFDARLSNAASGSRSPRIAFQRAFAALPHSCRHSRHHMSQLPSKQCEGSRLSAPSPSSNAQRFRSGSEWTRLHGFWPLFSKSAARFLDWSQQSSLCWPARVRQRGPRLGKVIRRLSRSHSFEAGLCKPGEYLMWQYLGWIQVTKFQATVNQSLQNCQCLCRSQ